MENCRLNRRGRSITPIKKKLNLDFLVIAYHQLIVVDKFFMETLVEGGITKTERETAATITVDIKNKKIMDAVKLNANYWKCIGHLLFVVPLGMYQYPEQDLCYLAGKYAAESISKKTSPNKRLRIAVVASKIDPDIDLYNPRPYPLQFEAGE